MNTAMSAPVEFAIPTRYSLLSRLQNREDHDSWKVFFDTYWRLIYALAIKSGLTETEAQDVVQETVITVARDIHKFKRDRALGSFKGWLRKIIRWRIVDQFRKRNLDKPRLEGVPASDDVMPDLDEIPDTAANLESQWEEEWRVNLFEAAVERVKLRVREEQYQIFDLHVIKGRPVMEVARTLDVNVGRVYLAKHRISALIKKEVQVLEKKLF
jgi:RNA polymerase sigma-70 factor (ECF subfamily)